MKPNIFSNENKSMLKNIAKCGAFLSMDSRKRCIPISSISYNHKCNKPSQEPSNEGDSKWCAMLGRRRRVLRPYKMMR